MSKLKVNEVTNNIINDAIFNYKNSNNNLENLIIVNSNNNEIYSVDVDMNKSYILLEEIVSEIRKNIKSFQITQYKYYNMESLKYINNSLVILIPMGAITGKNLIVNLGPKIPVKLSLLENVKGVVRTEAKEYGINNVLINVYINIQIEQNIEMPSVSDSFYNKYEMLLASKVIHGSVPNFIGNITNKESGIIQVPVN